MRSIDLIGKHVNDLFVIEYNSKSTGGNRTFRCLCVCGKECIKSYSGLSSGASKDCGCKKSDRLKNSKLSGWEVHANQVTKKFNHYFVLDYKDGKCSSSWKFICSICGDKFEASPK